ncbi:MAG: prephenate dehydratase [Desulfovibrio sp.]|nr:prephenate dehydratase [Desulfovibrio sp.]
MPECDSALSSKERLKAIRGEIDRIDRELLKLFNERAALSLEVGKIKASDKSVIFKPLREKEMMDKLAEENAGPLPDDHLRSIWREILSSSRALQRPQNVAYLGPEGTFSYFAGLEYLGHSARFHPCKDIAGIFEKVSSGECELGVVPLENSLQGTVGASFDLFLRHDAVIEAELYSRISHCLLSNADSLAAIETVYSHPQPLAQCGTWLRTHLPNAVLSPAESTAAAAERAATDPRSAAIGNCRLASLAGLDILARGIEDAEGNWTRFVIIAPAKALASKPREHREGAEKTSILFTLPDKPGSLSTILDLLAKNKVNLRKLESRPLSGQPWRYVFFTDVESDLNHPRHEKLVRELGEQCNNFRILGCYPMGPQLDRVPGDKDGSEGL